MIVPSVHEYPNPNVPLEAAVQPNPNLLMGEYLIPGGA